jgi:hypothetical protein
MKYLNIRREEELKNKVANDYFWHYDCTKIIGNVDFCVCMHQSDVSLYDQESLLWAEAKQGLSDVYNSIVQLILTIGKARTFDKYLPPPMLGAFDAEKIAFISYADVHDIFYLNDFNWNVTPSDHSTKEFKLIHGKVKTSIDQKALLFNYEKDDKELQKFIRSNFVVGKFGMTKTKIDKNNFMIIYNKWLVQVKPSIVMNWEVAKSKGLIDADFYLADLLSNDNESIKERLTIFLRKDRYELEKEIDDMGLFKVSSAFFNDKQVAHTQFWNRYERPPKEEYWNYIVERRDLLVPQDIRERKGSFFTPLIWVELSQKYLTDVLGEDWQDEYYVWDCAAGTGNLLTGLTNKYHIWASTLDKQDVAVMHDRIKNGANLLDEHVFQFDFLNDEFTKLPKPLQDIINDPEKRKKLVVYINPPYAEHGNISAKNETGVAKTGVANSTKIHKEFSTLVGTAARELFVQFFLRVYKDIPDSILASFGKLKHINSQNFLKFREYFKAEFKKGFIVQANTFDNVKGQFPIGFLIWDLEQNKKIKEINVEIFDSKGVQLSQKNFYAFENKDFISSWLRQYYDKKGNSIGYIILPGVDMQAQNGVYLIIQPTKSDVLQHKTALITQNNLIEIVIYLAIRHCFEATWLNDRDQFLYPSDGWKTDKLFQNDCLAFTLFHGQNRITSKEGTNHWIPFTEYEVNAREKFDSNFMSQFIKGKIKPEDKPDLFTVNEPKAHYDVPLKFSPEATEVMDAGKALWIYYHKQPNCNVNASLYDIREHFQGRNEAGKMKNKSEDETYMLLIGNMREKIKQLAKKIEPKVYEYGFLK